MLVMTLATVPWTAWLGRRRAPRVIRHTPVVAVVLLIGCNALASWSYWKASAVVRSGEAAPVGDEAARTAHWVALGLNAQGFGLIGLALLLLLLSAVTVWTALRK